MASSLKFYIESKYNSEGVQKARKSLLDLTATVAGTGLAIHSAFTNPKILAAFTTLGAKLKTLGQKIKRNVPGIAAAAGLIFVANQAFRAAKGIAALVPNARAAEVSINRLTIQLGLLNQASEENIKRINDFARETSFQTRFIADEVRQAVTESLRRTGDLEGSIRRVSIAQNIAAATGQDLQRSLRQVALAEQGRVRSIQLITNLTQQELTVAAKRGEILDVLEKKFKDAAEAEADTVEGLRTRLASVEQDTNRLWGSLTIRSQTFGAKWDLFWAEAINSVSKFTFTSGRLIREFFTGDLQGKFFDIGASIAEFTKQTLRSGDAVTFLGESIKKANREKLNLGRLDDPTESAISLEAEFLAKSVGKSREERIALGREKARIKILLDDLSKGFIKVTDLTAEQKELLDKSQAAQQQFRELIILTARTNLQDPIDKENARRERIKKEVENRGNIVTKEEISTLKEQLKQGNITTQEFNKAVSALHYTRLLMVRENTESLRNFNQATRKQLEEANKLGATQLSLLDIASNRLKTVAETVSAAVTPVVDITFNLEPDALKAKIELLVRQAINNVLNRIDTSQRNSQRQQDINSNIE